MPAACPDKPGETGNPDTLGMGADDKEEEARLAEPNAAKEAEDVEARDGGGMDNDVPVAMNRRDVAVDGGGMVEDVNADESNTLADDAVTRGVAAVVDEVAGAAYRENAATGE